MTYFTILVQCNFSFNYTPKLALSVNKLEIIDRILRCLFKVCPQKYHERKEFLLGMLDAECAKLKNQTRFILEKIEEKMIIGALLKKHSRPFDLSIVH